MKNDATNTSNEPIDAKAIKEIAEESLLKSGLIYDHKYGLYYDHKRKLYYDPVIYLNKFK